MSGGVTPEELAAWREERSNDPERLRFVLGVTHDMLLKLVEEMSQLKGDLRAFVAELRERNAASHVREGGIAVGWIADQIEARFLTPATVAEPVRAYGEGHDG